ncbi:MAG: hypothetical protein JWO68_766, partial [Actinomycetia bacterium]|nr:hypothetical protein [Actinomycetes bacterium]
VPFGGTGARIAGSVAEAVRDADIVITMVSDADAVMDVALRHGMLGALRPGAIWVQMSTIGIAGFDRVARAAGASRPDVAVVDAPVSGSSEAAEHGALTIFASGPDCVSGRLQPVFDALARRTLWLGPAGLGTRLKLASNTMVAFISQGLGEALAVAHHLNLTTDAVSDAFETASFSSPWLSHKLSRISRGNYDAEFALGLALKDVNLALDTLDPERHPVFTALASQWQEAADDGSATQDLTAIARVLAEPS